jgi:hypothetical protein
VNGIVDMTAAAVDRCAQRTVNSRRIHLYGTVFVVLRRRLHRYVRLVVYKSTELCSCRVLASLAGRILNCTDA